MNTHIGFEAGAEELPMVDVYLPMMKSAAIISAGQLGLFEALADGPLDVAALALRLKCSQTGVERLSEFLVTIGYLVRSGAQYQNSTQAARWFTRKGQNDYTPGLKWTAASWGLMSTLTDCVREGGPRTTLWEQMEAQPAWGPAFSQYMHSFAGHLEGDLIAHVELPLTARKLLDLGGSHGRHSAAFCRKYTELQAVIVDHASAMSQTAQSLQSAGLGDRVRLTPGDLRTSSWGEDYDAVFLLSVMHNQTLEDSRRTIERVAKAMRTGGTFVIHEYVADPSRYNAAFNLTLLTETGTAIHSSELIESWLQESGFSAPRVVVLNPQVKGTLFISEKK